MRNEDTGNTLNDKQHDPAFLKDLARRRKEDFEFMVLCKSKHNQSMYRLLRDDDLDNYKHIKT